MRCRIRWQRLDVPSQLLRHLGQVLSKQEYTRRSAAGFRLTDVRRDYIAGRFIERVEWDDAIEDPAGGELVVHRVELRQLSFRIGTTAPELEISDGPRSMRSFLAKLAECSDRVMVPVAVILPPSDWLIQIEEQTGKLKVLSLTAAGLTLSASAMATIEIAGTEDVRKHLKQFNAGGRTTVTRLAAEMGAKLPGGIELSTGGRARIVDGNDKVLDLLRKSLQAALAAASRGE